MEGKACDLLLRVRLNRVLYFEPGPYAGMGRPRVHGDRFALADPTTGKDPAQVWEGVDAAGRRMHVQAWEKLHLSGAATVHGTLILAEWPDASGTRRDPKRLWLFYVGSTPPPLAQVGPLYPRRFSGEHFFRFEKTTLRWNRACLITVEASQRWTDLLPWVYWELWMARSPVQDLRLPWDRTPRKALTLGQVRRSLGGLLARMGTPACAAKPRGKSPGRRKGEHPLPPPLFSPVLPAWNGV